MSRYLDELRYRRDKAIALGDHAALLMLEARIADELRGQRSDVREGVRPEAIPPRHPGRSGAPSAA